jgi:hypothetical protein
MVKMEVRGHLNLRKKQQELEQSGHQIDILSRPEVSHCLVYLSVLKSHDNSYCGWCCSIDCAQATMWVGGSLAELTHWLNQHGTVEVQPMPRVSRCSASTTSRLCKYEATVPPTIAIITRFLGVLVKRAMRNFLSTPNICLVP